MRTSMWWRRVVTYFNRGRLDDELRAEIDDHLERRRRQLIAEGMSPTEADAAARRAFGNVASVRDRMHDGWGFASLDSLLQDVRYGARILRRAPAFTAVAVLSLSLGIGAAAAVFNVADAVLFRSLSVRDPEHLQEVRATFTVGSMKKNVSPVSAAVLNEIRRSGHVAQATGFRTMDAGEMSAGAGPRPVRVEFVAPNYFDVLGVVAAAGRTLTASDAGTAPVPIVLSESLWRSAFGAEPSVVGRTVTLNATPSVVVGVARGFRGMLAERPADVLVPAAAAPVLEPTAATAGLRVIARMAPGASPVVAAQKLAALYIPPGSMMRGTDLRVVLVNARHGVSDVRETLERPLTVGLALVAVLMLLASANAGGLLLARFAARQGEFGVRVAIGAGRGRLLRQVLCEVVLLAAMAGATGLVVAAITAPALLRSMPIGSVPSDFEVRFDWRLIAFTAAVAMAAALIAAGASVLRLLRTNTAAILTLNSRSVVRGRRSLTQVLIAAQVACSLLLLVAAATMTRSLANLHRVDPGFDTTGAVAITVDALGRVPNADAFPAYFSRIYERLTATPGIARVSFAHVGLMTVGATTGTIDVPGWTPSSDEERFVRKFWVGPGFFETTGMRLLAGSTIGPAEAAGRERVVVVNQEFARLYFGSPGNAVGRTVNKGVRILGVVNDARYTTLREAPVRAMFEPHTQAPPRSAMTFVVRAEGDPAAATREAVAAIRAHDPRLRVAAEPLADVIGATLARERFVAALASIVCALAVLLSCAGLYASVAYAVSERRRELAVRLALGATGADIIRLVVRDPVRITLIGMIVGIPGAYAMTRAVASMLFGIEPFDPATVATSCAGLLAVATAAALVPARRATAIDAQESLKVL